MFSKTFQIWVQKIYAIFEMLARFQTDFPVELEKCEKMPPWTQKSASIQPIFWYFKSNHILIFLSAIFWYFGPLPNWNQSWNISAQKSAPRNQRLGVCRARCKWRSLEKFAELIRRHLDGTYCARWPVRWELHLSRSRNTAISPENWQRKRRAQKRPRRNDFWILWMIANVNTNRET